MLEGRRPPFTPSNGQASSSTNWLRHYEAELAQGHLVVDVTVHGRQERETVVQVLRSYGAHFINAYGPWTIESVAA